MKSKEQLVPVAKSISEISHQILIALNGKIVPDHRDSYFLGILRRTTVILNDISVILDMNDAANVPSAFILFRCLLDDFIHIVYLEHHNYDEEEIIKITADAHRQRFKTIEESKK